MKTLVAVVGMKHRGTEALVASLPEGEPLSLLREPTNQFDRNAIQVWARGQHIGYVKGSQNRELAMAMDRNIPPLMRQPPDGPNPIAVCLPAKLAIDGGKWPMVEIGE